MLTEIGHDAHDQTIYIYKIYIAGYQGLTPAYSLTYVNI